MSLVLVVAIGVVALALTAGSLRRAWSDRRSLERHHKTLDTLGEIAHDQDPRIPASPDHEPHFHVRVIRPEEARSPAEPSPGLPTIKPWIVPGHLTGPSSEHAGDVPAAPLPVPAKPPPSPPEVAAALVAQTVNAPVAPRRTRYARRRRHPSKPVLAAAGTVAAAIVAVVLALVLTGRSPTHRVAAGSSSPPSTAATTSTAPPAAASPPRPPPPVLVASDQTGATFSVASQFQIQLVPSSTCWVQVRTGSAAGPVVYEGILQPGQPYPLPATGPVWLRLGNPPGVSVVVNGTPLQGPLPSTAQPYNLQFQVAAAAA